MTFDANDAASGVDGIRREILGWDEFGEAARTLASDVLGAGFRPDVVIAIARGGLLLAGAISYALGTKACGSINVEFYSGIDERLHHLFAEDPGARVHLYGKQVRPGRKIGHVTVLGTDPAQVRTRAQRAARWIADGGND